MKSVAMTSGITNIYLSHTCLKMKSKITVKHSNTS